MSTNKKLLSVIAVGSGVLVGAYYAVSPWLTVNKLKQAFEEKDTRQIEKIVDFPELRQDFKETAKATIMKRAAKELEGNPFAALGMMMANAIIDPLIDQVVSPAGLEVLFTTGEVSLETSNISGETKSESDSRSSKEEFELDPDLRMNMYYTEVNEFKIEISNKDVVEPIAFYMERDGFADWKVTGMEIPQSVFDN